jgi:proteasome lid subunit RPN8/RPN11
VQITVAKDALRNFRRRATRRYPKECIETLWGLKNGHWRITEFRPIPHDGSRRAVYFNDDDAKFGARDGKLTRVGTIHTHTILGSDCSPSEHDWDDCANLNELITGICTVEKSKTGRLHTRVRFFLARATCEVTLK